MKQKFSSEEWIKDFQEYLSAGEVQPPKRISEQVLNRVHHDLNPSWLTVFSKLLLVHAIVGTFTLLFCPYSELYFFQSMNLMNLLMRFGEQACMAGCGAVFLGGSAFTASLVLRSEEVQVIRKNRILHLTLVALISTAFFACTGLLLLQGLAIFWTLGSVLGGLLTLQCGWTLRSWLRSAYATG